MADTRPLRIGRYEVIAELGRGAMGVVYQARDPELARVVALKTLRRDLGLPPEPYAELTRRFRQEAMAAGRLNHPGIVAVHDVLDVDGTPYIVMEYLEGPTLAGLIAREGQLSAAEAVRLFAHVCDALEYAHAHGVVHRDIKPGNIVVTRGGIAKVTDFGIARVSGSTVTQTGAVLGTPAYMSPEQLRGRTLDGRSDLFAVGVSIYEALAGANPFQADDLATVLYRVVHEAPPPLAERNPAVPARLQAVVEQAMAKDPDARHPTARALGDALAAALEPGPEGARAAGPRPGASRPSRAILRAGLVGAAAGLLLLAGGGWAVWSRWSEPEAGLPEPSASGGGRGGAGATVEKPGNWWPLARTPARGVIRVTTDPAVQVLVDGEIRGTSDASPLVITDVTAGDRLVTLRRGAREHSVVTTVRGGQTVVLSYYFPSEPDPDPLGRLRETVERRSRDALDRLRGGVDRAQRGAAEKLREALDRVTGGGDSGRGSGGASGAGGRPPAKPDTR